MNRHLLTTLGLPALALLAALGWSLSILDELPGPVATTFATDGTPTAFLGVGWFLALMVLTGVILLGVFGGITRAGSGSTAMTRLMAGIGAAAVVFNAALLVLVLHPQRGLADAADSLLPSTTLPLAAAAAAVGGLLVALLATPAPYEEEQFSADPVELTASSRAVWFGTGRASTALMLAFGSVPVVALGFLVAGMYRTALSIAAAAFVLVMFLRVSVRIDARGIHWRLFPGLLRSTIPWSDVTGVETADLRTADWGGWGWRISPKGTAILLRMGEGLHVRKKGRDLYISVDDAARGAALGEAYLRARQSS